DDSPCERQRQPVTVSVPFMPDETWNVQMNGYVPGGKSTFTVADLPAWFTTLMPFPWIVNVCAVEELTFFTVSVVPFDTESDVGEKTSWFPAPCWSVADPPEPPQADPTMAATTRSTAAPFVNLLMSPPGSPPRRSGRPAGIKDTNGASRRLSRHGRCGRSSTTSYVNVPPGAS